MLLTTSVTYFLTDPSPPMIVELGRKGRECACLCSEWMFRHSYLRVPLLPYYLPSPLQGQGQQRTRARSELVHGYTTMQHTNKKQKRDPDDILYNVLMYAVNTNHF